MSESTVKHLWEYDHPYYCQPFNFRVPLNEHDGQNIKHSSWAEFADLKGDSDPDCFLVFRWDWTKPDPDDYEQGEDVEPDTLDLFVMLQGSGDYWCHTITVTDDDEPAVRAWLTERAKTIAALWAPINLTGIEATR